MRRILDDVRRAFGEFLMLPTALVVGMLLLAAGMVMLDRYLIGAGENPVQRFLRSHLFTNAGSTASLLSTVASGVINVTSLTITVLLIVVQQSASTMTTQVFDQFLRRRHNQVYFGYFVGLALYALVVLSTVDEPFNPVLAATLALLLMIAGLYLLLILVYTTINQMRPAVIVDAIRDHILSARDHQEELARRTRNVSSPGKGVHLPVTSTRHGFVTRIGLDELDSALRPWGDDAEVDFEVAIGGYVAFGEVLARVRAPTPAGADALAHAVIRALRIEQQRDIDRDPAYGIEQLQMIAWTCVSTAKQTAAPGLLAIRAFRDVLARWTTENPLPDVAPLPIVYRDDVVDRLFDAFEALAVVSSESMQQEILIEVFRSFVRLFDRLSPTQQGRMEDIILRSLSCLGDHVLTAGLESILAELTGRLDAAGRSDTASAVQRATDRMQQSIGTLNSRSTRTTGSQLQT